MRSFLASTACVIVLACGVHGGTYLVWESLFARSTGQPLLDSSAFGLRTPGAEYLLKVQNGPDGRERISSAEVWINGAVVVAENELNQNVAQLERPIALRSTNVLVAALVLLRSRPEGALLCQVWGVDNASPSISVLSPNDGAVVATNRPIIAVTYDDAESGIDPSSLQVLVNGQDRTQSFSCRLAHYPV